MIVLQELLLSNNKEYCMQEMLYRGKTVIFQNNCLTFKNEISFDTYFNMFSSCKWNTYTKISTVSFKISLQGRGKIEVVAGNQDNIKECIIKEIKYNSDKIITIDVLENCPIMHLKDYCYIKILSDGYTSIFNGKYYSNDDIISETKKYALGICTFKRETDVERNIKILIQEILDNKESPLYNLIDIYISDNGNTLPLKKWNQYPFIHIFYNKNYGGSAGFTRTMIESEIYKNDTFYNYIILMDDDILLLPSVFIRLHYFVRVLKDEFKNSIIGGANLNLQKKNIQSETCGFYNAKNGRNIITKQNGLDLCNKENIIFNEKYVNTNFCGWWFSCIPEQVITEQNLPLPLFLHRDDQEYGARTEKKVIGLNGICIWHPKTSGKHPDYIWYYEARNMLIASMSLCPEEMTSKQLKKEMLRMAISSCLAYRYGKAEMILRGYEEFLDGVDNFKKINPEKNHINLIMLSKRDSFLIDKESLLKVKKKSTETKVHILIRIARYFFPSFRDCYVEDECSPSAYVGKRKVFVVNSETKSTYLLEKDWKKTLGIVKKMFVIMRKIDRDYIYIKKEWIEAVKEFKTIDFWKKYLEI